MIGRRILSVLFLAGAFSASAVGGDLAELDEKLRPLIRNLVAQGATEISLGGGSALAVIDHLYRGAPLAVRDVDLFAVVPNVDRSRAAGVGRSLQNALNWRYFGSRIALRGNPSLPFPDRCLYVAAYHLQMRAGGPFGLFDVSFFPARSDVGLFGVLANERLRIPMGSEGLAPLERMAKKYAYEKLVEQGQVVDTHGGYESWTRGELRVVEATDLECNPALMAVRLLRAYSKVGQDGLPLPLEAELARRIQAQVGMRLVPDGLEFGAIRVPWAVRKMFGDPDPLPAIRRISEMGVVNHWPQELEKHFLSLPRTEKVVLASAPVDFEWGRTSAAGVTTWTCGGLLLGPIAAVRSSLRQ